MLAKEVTACNRPLRTFFDSDMADTTHTFSTKVQAEETVMMWEPLAWLVVGIIRNTAFSQQATIGDIKGYHGMLCYWRLA